MKSEDKDELIFQYRMKDLLTKREQQVADFYDDNPLASRLDCSKHIYGGANVFQLQNLSSIECSLRKKGYLFYTINGHIIDMARKDVDVNLKLKVQQKVGSAMIGHLKSNIRIMQVATDQKQFDLIKTQFKDTVQVLLDEKIINVPNFMRYFKVEPRQKLLKTTDEKTS